MSIEESMKAQADAMNNLAAAMNNYASVMSSIASRDPQAVVSAPQPTTDAAPAAAAASTTDKKKGGRPSKAEKEAAAAATAGDDAFGDNANEEDPFGEDAAPVQKALTAEDIRGLVLKVKEKNKDHALALLKKIGVSTLGQIEEKDYPKVVELAGKCGVTL